MEVLSTRRHIRKVRCLIGLNQIFIDQAHPSVTPRPVTLLARIY
jgi:hypothetical protein